MFASWPFAVGRTRRGTVGDSDGRRDGRVNAAVERDMKEDTMAAWTIRERLPGFRWTRGRRARAAARGKRHARAGPPPSFRAPRGASPTPFRQIRRAPRRHRGVACPPPARGAGTRRRSARWRFCRGCLGPSSPTPGHSPFPRRVPPHSCAPPGLACWPWPWPACTSGRCRRRKRNRRRRSYGRCRSPPATTGGGTFGLR